VEFEPGTFGTFPLAGAAGGVVTYNTFPPVGETFLWFDVQHSCTTHENASQCVIMMIVQNSLYAQCVIMMIGWNS